MLGSSKYLNGGLIGSSNDSTPINSIIYDVEFPDGAVKLYAIITITENLFYHVGSEGCQYSFLETINDYKKDERALEK